MAVVNTTKLFRGNTRLPWRGEGIVDVVRRIDFDDLIDMAMAIHMNIWRETTDLSA